MQIVIDIPDEIRKSIFDDVYCGIIDKRVFDAIKHGIPLPKGHGRIVDISQMQYMKTLNEAVHNRLSWVKAIRRIKNSAPTIVEADVEGDE